MIARHFFLREKLTWWMAAAFGALVYLTLPSQVVPLNDDFGYLRSVLETLQHGRPWTNDWLAPWAASLSVLSAVTFKMTGSMYVATVGLQAVYAAVAFAGLCVLWRGRGLSHGSALFLSGGMLLCPTVLWKLIEYTSLVLYLPCLFWAVWAAERKRWGWFFIAWALAIASRQSAVTWLAIPAWHVLTSVMKDSSAKSWRAPLLVFGMATVIFVLLSRGMNKTHSQLAVTDHVFDHFNREKAWRGFVPGVVIGFCFMGIGAFVVNWRRGYALVSTSLIWKVPVVLLAAGAIVAAGALSAVNLEHDCYEGSVGLLYLVILCGIGMAGWIGGGFLVRWEMLLGALGSLLLVCLRGDVWDYYYIDVAIFSLFGVRLKAGERKPEEIKTRHWTSGFARGLCVLLSGASLWFLFQFKVRIDRAQAVCVVAEKALRSGNIDVSETEYTTFGFVGWHLHPHFIAHEGKMSANIAGFTDYLQASPIEVRMSRIRFWKDSKSLQPVTVVPEGSKVLGTELFRVGWLRYQRCTLIRHAYLTARPGALKLPTTFVPPAFPLNDDEWRDLVAGKSWYASKVH